jgi:SAM-dependent methyltransferase
MSVRRITDAIEDYRLKAVEQQFHRMAGRDDRTQMTEFVNSRIVDLLDLQPSDVVLDIGCGDGCLLRKIKGKVAHAIGTLPTREEQERLQADLPGADIRRGLLDKLPIEPGIASKVVCNSVFVLLPSLDAAREALIEIARVSKLGGTILIGEVPEVDEAAALGSYRGDSIPGLLLFLLRRQGVRAFAGMCRRIVLSWFGRYQIVLYPYRFFFAPPAEFTALAEACGLSLVRYFRHQDGRDERGKPVFSRFRYDYVFTRMS